MGYQPVVGFTAASGRANGADVRGRDKRLPLAASLEAGAVEVDCRAAGRNLGGTPVGIYALSNLPSTPIRLGLAIVVFAAVILILRGFALRNEPSVPATVGVGLAADALNGSMGIVGPPVILFYFSSPVGIVAGRASIVTYFIGTDTVGTAVFAAQDLVGPSVLWRTAVFLPLLIAGVAIGNRGFLKTDPDTFKKAALFVLMALSILLFVRAVWPN